MCWCWFILLQYWGEWDVIGNYFTDHWWKSEIRQECCAQSLKLCSKQQQRAVRGLKLAFLPEWMLACHVAAAMCLFRGVQDNERLDMRTASQCSAPSHTVRAAGCLVGWGGGDRGGFGSPRAVKGWVWRSTGDCRRWPERRRCSSAGVRVRPRSLPSDRSSLGGGGTTPRPSYKQEEPQLDDTVNEAELVLIS